MHFLAKILLPMVRKTDGQKNITVMIIKGADVLDHYNIDLLLKRRGEKSEKAHPKKKEKKRQIRSLRFFSRFLSCTQEGDEGGECDHKIRHLFFFFVFPLIFFLCVSLRLLQQLEWIWCWKARKQHPKEGVRVYLDERNGILLQQQQHTHIHEGKEEE